MADYEDMVKDYAEKLGGGWRMERGGLMPVVILTLPEAAGLVERLGEEPFAIEVETDKGTLHYPWKDVKLVYLGAD